MKIAVVGAGYVGLSNAILLAQHNQVVAYDISAARVAQINENSNSLIDSDAACFLQNQPLALKATTNAKHAFSGAEFILIATPTDYDLALKMFDTTSVDSAIREAREANKTATIVIRSTVPVGYTTQIREEIGDDNIIFSPEFLREDRALLDILFPSRIVVGGDTASARVFARLLKHGSARQEAPVLFTGTKEAEAIKLFANSYLAMRVAFFNELDSYAMTQGIDTRQIIEGVCHDPRIGNHYNNPSFGYGGYCLPKDSKQLLSTFDRTPQNLIEAIVKANVTRRNFLVDAITSVNAKTIGVYRLTMKTQSDNFRSSSILGIMRLLARRNVPILVYEPLLRGEPLDGYDVVTDLAQFKKNCDLIISNRRSPELDDVKHKVFTRDVFNFS